MTDLRPPRLEDAPDLARLHVQSWRETYPGLLPESEIAARDYGVRLRQWRQMITQGHSRIAYAPGLGFAQMGPQRDDGLAARGYDEELYCLYVLAQAHGTGLGQRLFAAVRGTSAFTALVLSTNGRACGFYAKAGGTKIETRSEHMGTAPIEEDVYVWPAITSGEVSDQQI